MSKSLFSEFEQVSAKQWKQKIQVDLKGADYNNTLIWQSLEGIDVKPFYHKDDFSNAFTEIPGQPNDWSIIQQVFIDDETISNHLIIDALSRGAEGVYLSAEKTFNITKVFDKIPLKGTTIYFQLNFLDENFIQNLITFFDSKEATVFYNVDIIQHLCKDGNWFSSLETDHHILENLVCNNPTQSILSVDSSIYQNAGANMVQQLAYSMAHTNEYLNHFQDSKSLQLNFKVAVGSNYFFEIAKIRALRLLYATIASAYDMNEECNVFVIPSKRNKTLYDYNVNMLRTTTEAMSGVLAGANSICNLPYDAIYHKSNEFGERISRNQLLILKNESYFDVVSNPSDGSYYIEKLTEELAEKALLVFKEIEKSGGFLKQLKAGVIQKKIKESAQKEQSLFDEGNLTLVGTNKFQNENDKMANDLEIYPFVKIKNRKTIIKPIIEKRLSETLEKERITNEKK